MNIQFVTVTDCDCIVNCVCVWYVGMFLCLDLTKYVSVLTLLKKTTFFFIIKTLAFILYSVVALISYINNYVNGRSSQG